MSEIRYTLLSDGSSDRALLPILTWLFRTYRSDLAIQPQWADLRRLPSPLPNLSQRVLKSLELYPCHLLFIHRDSEKEPRNKRIKEIYDALEEAGEVVTIPTICVVPVRMTEAWLLFDETAIRKAAGNPKGKQSLQLPPLSKVEQLPDPKNDLCQLLRQASGFTGRKLKIFKAKEREKIQRVAELIDDFSSLRALAAFQQLEADLDRVLQDF
jgi:hypothetical protein